MAGPGEDASDLRFDGFGDEAVRFLTRLGRDNSREWFSAHRAEYDRVLRRPLEALLARAEPRYGPGRVMRPNRDVRFSADKRPYRTTASMWAGDVGGVYLQIGEAGVETGGGLYEPTRDQLGRARAVIDQDDGAAARLDAVITGLQDAGFEIAGPSLTTAPRGYPRDHPRIELLRLRHFAAVRHLRADAALDDIEGAWSAVEPLNGWVARYVGPALAWP